MYQIDEKMESFLRKDRWEKHIQRAAKKGISKGLLAQLCNPSTRLTLANLMLNDEYRITPPYIGQIPKDSGGYREVYINQPLDRIVLSIANDVYYDIYKDLIHPSCISYQPKIGVGMKIKELSRRICSMNTYGQVGVKIDFTKYFDTLNKESLYKMLDRMNTGSALDNIIINYYKDDHIITREGDYVDHYKSIAQGCALGGLLANIALREVDAQVSSLDVVYYRYSDDVVIIGRDWKKGYSILKSMISPMGVKINPKKVEPIYGNQWFTFLGFSIKGSLISVSKNKIQRFEHEIHMRTTHNNKVTKSPVEWGTANGAMKSIQHFLYSPTRKDNFSWAEYIFSTVNAESDIIKFDEFVKDSLRAMQTNRRHIGGLGFQTTLKNGVVDRGIGHNVSTNSERVDIPGYVSMHHMYKLYKINREVFRTYLREMMI